LVIPSPWSDTAFEIAFAVVGWQVGLDLAARRYYEAFQTGLTRLGAPVISMADYALAAEVGGKLFRQIDRRVA
jgi:hypothetical protein